MMNKEEAKTMLRKCLEQYRELSYEELKNKLGEVEVEEVIGPSGTKYQVEVQVFWDDKPGDNIRLMASIDDSGVRTFYPLTGDFIKGPSGEFVDE